MLVIKRDRREVPFDAEKIQKAIYNSSEGRFTEEQSKELTKEVLKNLPKKDRINIEEIQKEVIKVLRKSNNDVANAYVLYRRKRTLERQRRGEMMKNFISKLEMTNVVNQNANVDEVSFGGRKGEAADVLLKDYALNYCMSDMSRENHINNEIYIHDLNSYSLGLHNCLSLPFDDLLKNGFRVKQTDVRPAQSVSTAMQLVAVIFQIQSLCQFGLPM